METEIIDKLFLELSQVSTARTEREMRLESLLSQVLNAWVIETNWGDGIDENNKHIFNRAMKCINPDYEP